MVTTTQEDNGISPKRVSRRHGARFTARFIFVAVMAMVALTALAACGDSAQPTATTAPAPAPAPAATATPAGSDVAPPAVEPTATTAPSLGDAVPPAGTVTEVSATLREWAIDLSQDEVPAGKVKFTVTNQGQMQHNLTVLDASGTVGATPTFGSSAGPQTLEVELKPGTYTLICSLPGHAARGQKITLTVK